MRVTVNGEPRDLPPGTTVASVVASEGARPDGRGVAVAVNGEVVQRSSWERTELRDGDRVEVLAAIGGG